MDRSIAASEKISETIIAIGDIHGCAKTLEAMITRLQAYPEATFVFLGDYIDRGPDSYSVIEQLQGFSSTYSCHFLRGNHEQMMLDCFYEDQSEHWDQWFLNGGKQTMDSYTRRATHPLEAPGHADFISQTELFVETDDFVFVHGGMNPLWSVQQNLNESDPFDFMWERRHIKEIKPDWEKTVVFGHTPVHEVIMEPNLIALDTGCVFVDRGYGTLSAIILPERALISIKNQETAS